MVTPPITQVIRTTQENEPCNLPSMNARHVETAHSARVRGLLLVVAKPARMRACCPLTHAPAQGVSSLTIETCTDESRVTSIKLTRPEPPSQCLWNTGPGGTVLQQLPPGSWGGDGPWDLGEALGGQAGSEPWSSESAPVPSPSCFSVSTRYLPAHLMSELQGNPQNTASSFIVFFWL